MQSHSSRLDRFISEKKGIKRGDVRLLLAQGRLSVDGSAAIATNQTIGQFSHVSLDGETLQANIAQYVMLNKPAGVVSATKDPQHQTVIDLIRRQNIGSVDVETLHIAGRLDYHSTGLLLLTNDGRWSRGLSDPVNSITKHYRVSLEKPVSDECIHGFKEGLYFAHEGLTTRPADIHVLSNLASSQHSPGVYNAEVFLTEGRYHQIKRMFGRYNNKVIALHRVAIGSLLLDANLAPGQGRMLRNEELAELSVHTVPYTAQKANQKVICYAI